MECEESDKGLGDGLGCVHYRRKATLKAPCCGKYVSCRICHDEQENHEIDRHAVTEMRCLVCGHEQAIGRACSACGQVVGRYYCEICKLLDDSEEKLIFHCARCGICRKGGAENYFHCDVCDACINVEVRDTHKCIPSCAHSDCPICLEFLFTSTEPVMFLKCGHPLHQKCLEEYSKHNSVCPLCSKFIYNTREFDQQIAFLVEEQKMPEEYRDVTATIDCNECSRRSTVPYHFLNCKCGHCSSYNTYVFQVHKPNEP